MTRLSLTTRVALLFALWTAIPLGVVAIYNHFAAREQLRASTRAQNLQAARGTVEKLDLYLQDILNGVRTVASVPSLAKFLAGRGIREAASDAQASSLGLRKIGGYEALYLTDQLGTVILATERRFLGRSYLAARWFRAAAAGQELADEFRFDTEDRRVYLHLSAPVRNAGGVIVGALVGRVTTAPIDRMVAGDSGYSGRG
ncbi:MAG: cache domain-containing protein, partial [Acidobacteria bacterium]|nr:cache domain-containing protein [Acidobacteriota bacterium]